MDIAEVKRLIDVGNIDAVEDAWMEAIEQKAPLHQMCEVIEALAEAKRTDTLETLAEMFLTETIDRGPAGEALTAARLVLPAMAASDELRKAVAQLYRQVHGQAENLEDFLKASGLEAHQSTRRAMRTLDTCLGATEGDVVFSPGVMMDINNPRVAVTASSVDNVFVRCAIAAPMSDMLTPAKFAMGATRPIDPASCSKVVLLC